MGLSKKINIKKNLLLVFSVLLVLSICIVFVNASTNNAPQAAIDALNERLPKMVDMLVPLDNEQNDYIIYDKNKFSVGDGYKLNFFKKELKDEYAKLSSFDNFIYPSDDWLFILNYDNIPQYYVTVVKRNNSYKVVEFGGNAEVFSEIINRAHKVGFKNLRILNTGRYYSLVNERGEVFEIPSSKQEYQENKSLYDSGMKADILVDKMKQNFKLNAERAKKGEEVPMGSGRLIDLYIGQ